MKSLINKIRARLDYAAFVFSVHLYYICEWNSLPHSLTHCVPPKKPLIFFNNIKN